jgi:hypothetical protein
MSQEAARPLPGTTYDPLYPSSREGSLADTDFHTNALFGLRECLEACLEGRPGAFVSTRLDLECPVDGGFAWYAPDLFVVIGAPRRPLYNYSPRQEGVVPQVVFEISSENSLAKDLGEKRQAYERLGIPEYFLFDSEGCWHQPVLQGFRLVRGAYVPMQPASDGGLSSAQLEVRLVPKGPMLRLIDQTNAPVPTRLERWAQERQRFNNAACQQFGQAPPPV